MSLLARLLPTGNTSDQFSWVMGSNLTKATRATVNATNSLGFVGQYSNDCVRSVHLPSAQQLPGENPVHNLSPKYTATCGI